MLRPRLQQLADSLREGFGAGFVAGVIILFLILIGIPIRIENLAVFLLLLTMTIFGGRIARRLHDEGIGKVIGNALMAALVGGVMFLLLMALINRWQANGTDVKRYFDAVTLQTTSVLSGIPEEELHPNPEIDPMTGEYVGGEPLRTDPMTLAFDTARGIHLKFGLTGDAIFDVSLGVGGLYGFVLLLIITALGVALLTWAWVAADVGRYRRRVSSQLSGNPITHWITLLLPSGLFLLLFLTEGQGEFGRVLHLQSGEREVQLLLVFLIILFALVAVRSAESRSYGLSYVAQVGIVAAVVVVILGIGIGRITGNNVAFIAPVSEPDGSQTYSIIALVVAGALLIAQSALALRVPGRFEGQFAGAQVFAVLLAVPLYLDQYQSDVMTLVGINIMLGLGLNIVVGYAGLLDLGYVAFFALGAYTYAFLSSNQLVFDDNNQPAGLKFAGNDATVTRMAAWLIVTLIVASLVVAAGLKLWQRTRAAKERGNPRSLLATSPRPSGRVTALLIVLAVGTSLIVAGVLGQIDAFNDLFDAASPFLVGLVAGVIVSGLAGIMLGIPVLRLRGDYLAIVTLGFGEIIRLLFNNLRDFTGGPQGVLGIPRPLPDDVSGTAGFLALLYLVLLGGGLIAYFSTRLKASRTGRAWSAMRSDEDIAQSMGVNLVQSKLMAFAIGAAFAGVGGVLFAARQRNIFPGDFRLDVSIEVLSLVIIGGMGSIPGVIMGAIVLIGVPEVLRELSTYRILVFGALLVAMVIIRPRGLLPAPPTELADRARRLVGDRQPHSSEDDEQ